MGDKPDSTGVYRPWPTRGAHGAMAPFIRRVATIRDAGGLPKNISLRSFKGGGCTAAGDAGLSDADISAVGAKTETIDLWRRGTMEQRRRALSRRLEQRSK
jgi:hypothetical protein